MKHSKFLKIATKEFKEVGAVMPSSKHAIRAILKHLKPEYKYIIEYGAGSGTITREILKALPSDGKILAVELNKKLFEELSKIKDSRLKVTNDNAVDVSKNLGVLDWPRIDAVISGIPFSFLKSPERKEIIKNTHDFLSLGGRFIVYQISLLALPLLKKSFKKIKKYFELRNIPPYFIMVGEKN